MDFIDLYETELKILLMAEGGEKMGEMSIMYKSDWNCHFESPPCMMNMP
jgi:hypothetical protein